MDTIRRMLPVVYLLAVVQRWSIIVILGSSEQKACLILMANDRLVGRGRSYTDGTTMDNWWIWGCRAGTPPAVR